MPFTPSADAPNIYAAFPLAGGRVGPAWKAAWDRLYNAWLMQRDGSELQSPWVPRDVLVEVMKRASGVKDTTARNLLRDGVRHSKLEQRGGERPPGAGREVRTPIDYRIPGKPAPGTLLGNGTAHSGESHERGTAQG